LIEAHIRIRRQIRQAGHAHARGEFGGGPGGGVLFRKSLFRHQALQAVRGAVLEDAGGLAAPGVADDQAAGRVGGFAGDARPLEGDAVGQRHVAIEAAEQHRMIGGGGVNHLAGGQRRAGPFLMIPVAPQNPLPFRDVPDVFPHAPGQFLRGGGLAQVNAGKRKPAHEEVGVRIVEAGQHQFAAGVNDAGSGAGEGADFIGRAQGGDAGAADGHGVGGGAGGVHGVDGGVEDDEVRGGHGVLCLDGSSQHG